MIGPPKNITTDMIEEIGHALGCEKSPLCPWHTKLAQGVVAGLSSKYTFAEISGQDDFRGTAEVAEDRRLSWAPACQRIERRLRGDLVVESLEVDLLHLRRIRESLEYVFGMPQ